MFSFHNLWNIDYSAFMRKSKALYDIIIEQVHTTELSFLFSETKSKW